MTMNITAANKITFDDILIGEVWLCSGQSNMEFGLGMTNNHAQEIAAADYPQIRLMKVDKSWKPAPQPDMTRGMESLHTGVGAAGRVGRFLGRGLFLWPGSA